MIKFKHLFYFVLLSVVMYSCGSDNSSNVDNFDYEAQALKDQDTIVKFLKSHYYKDDVDSIKPLITGKTALYKDTRLDSAVVNEYDIDYKYYYFVKGNNGISIKGFPTVTDSIFTTYRLSFLNSSASLIKEQDLVTPIWFDSKLIVARGWVHAFTHFKGGKNITDNGPINYEGMGEGFFLLPSGLSFRNSGALANKNLLYIVKLHDIVKDTDHDNDGIASIFEDIDGDGDPRNDDTDKNNVPDYLDDDDDGDNKLTKEEDANGDKDPRNDFSDIDRPNTPDYLNRYIR
ncbi:peptidylprolyl isomerase [Tenacibaculum aestuariivivum]|uniref:peptidylprolyl isomerase n=1 Tax=Tenacibaculum aestuariivivum TaxID=2006131 RepID=UPI003AB6B409